MSEDGTSLETLAGLVAELTRRVSEVENRLPDAPGGTGDDRGEDDDVGAAPFRSYGALPQLREHAASVTHGAVLFAGSVVLPGGRRAEWEQSAATDSVLGADWSELADVLGALGQPVRLRLVQAVLEGRSTVAELTELEGLGTTGQIYHHLRQLVSAGWLETVGRGHYQVPPTRLVPLLVVIAAARH
ncbi:ArsR/SmtB family transcription factor [Streptomyces sp. NPDC057496]|uniref:ArsR/SmtB family transcription factor n=1 Tax=Streptomyces sp. NPDC057496 TaxID=3346149 RepID=UPI00368A91D9